MYDPFADTISDDARAEAERFRANARSQLDLAVAPMNVAAWREERARRALELEVKPETA